MSDERRLNDERITVLEVNSAVNNSQHCEIQKSLLRIEEKLDKYNGVREKIDNMGRWQDNAGKVIGGIIVGICIIVFELIVGKTR